MFEADIEKVADKLDEAVGGKRILVIGGAGSIGSSTVAQIAARGPAALHVVDQNENALVELVRQLRAQPGTWSAGEFRTLPLDYGSQTLRYFLDSEKPYDIVLNFAALKHVRSEKDPYSALQIFDTNLLKQARLMQWLAGRSHSGRLFNVSTDKAANPTSMMGASKRVMEHVLFNSSRSAVLPGAKASARFANVAFSNGSLLQGFENRFARGEPLAAPRETKRYFVSLPESGQICIIAACLAPDRTIVIPKLDPARHLVDLEGVASRFIEAHGYAPVLYEDEAAACRDVHGLRAAGKWPLLLTPLNTAGEKPYEEFTMEGETAFEIGLPNLMAVGYVPAERRRIDRLIEELTALLADTDISAALDKDRLKELIAHVEPGFLDTHRETGVNLDQRL